MPNRAHDWFAQAERDLDQARASERDGRHEWACFAAQQSAEMALKALHLSLGQEAWGHVSSNLLPRNVLHGAGSKKAMSAPVMLLDLFGG
jgi:HEPN domain-containing protein